MFSFVKIAAVVAACQAVVVSALPGNFTEREEELVSRATKSVVTHCTVPHTFALTFDDGPYIYNAAVVSQLNAAGAKGTFFVNGNNYDCIYSSAQVTHLKAALAAGHQIASHTWDHKDLTTLSSSQIDAEYHKVDTAFEKILGVKAAFIRPPYGNTNSLSLSRAVANGQQMVTWSFDSLDSDGASVATSENRYKSLLASKPSSVIALNHETEPGTVNKVLPYVLNLLKGKGYKLVTVAECLGKSPYLSQTTPKPRDSTWHC